jgi:hemolysin III
MYYGERLNSISHLVGAVFALIGLGALITVGIQTGERVTLVSFVVFGITMVLLFTMSTLYHSFHPPELKRLFKVLDHVSIYVLIAGTYTPFTLVSLRGGWGWTLFVIVWGLALVGVVYKITAKRRYRLLSVFLYVGMGWLVLVAIKPMVSSVAMPGLVLLLAGGLFYTLGLIFYVWKRLPYSHAVWHLFVLGGSICHFFAVLLYVIPRPS